MDTEPGAALVPTTPMHLLSQAVANNVDTDKLEKLMALQGRWEKNQAEKAFNVAMNECQAKMPTVVRDKKNTQTGKLYAPVETVQSYAKPVYIAHGFSLTFGTEIGSEPGLTHCYVDVRHAAGHTVRQYIHNLGLDNKGPKGNDVKTEVQGMMSTLSYAQGRLIRLAFNIIVGDEDRDGQSSTITPDQMGVLNDAILACEQASAAANLPESSWLKYKAWFKQWLDVESFDELTLTKYSKALDELARKRKECGK